MNPLAHQWYDPIVPINLGSWLYQHDLLGLDPIHTFNNNLILTQNKPFTIKKEKLAGQVRSSNIWIEVGLSLMDHVTASRCLTKSKITRF